MVQEKQELMRMTSNMSIQEVGLVRKEVKEIRKADLIEEDYWDTTIIRIYRGNTINSYC